MNSPSSQETQLGDDLRQLAAGQPFTPNLAAISQRARRQRNHTVARRGAAGLAGVAVLAAGGVLVSAHGPGVTVTGKAAAGPAATVNGGAAVSQPASAKATAPTVITVAYVTARVKAALGNVDGYVVRDSQLQTGPGGDSSVILTDPRTSNAYEVQHDSNGKSLAWLSTYLVHRVLTWRDIEADYSTRTWFNLVFHAAGPIQGSTAGATSTVMTPATVKALLDAGALKIVGRQVIDGHHTIGLRQDHWARGYRELWVDSTTFLPVRLITADFADQQGPLRSDILIDNETWLPRTPALLNTVNKVHLPAGFAQVAPPQ